MNERAVKWLYAVPGKRKFCILVLMIVQALYGGSGVLYALLLRGIVDHAVDHDSEGFWLYVVLTAALVVGQITLWALIRWLSDYSKAAIENTFKERLMRNVLQKDFASVSAIHSGEWLNRLTNDTVVIAENYVDILPGLAGMTVKLVSAVVMMIVLDRTFALLLIPCGLLLLVLTSVFRKVLKKLHKNVQEKDGKLRIFWQERISSLMMIRSYAAEEQTMAGADTRMEDHKAARLKRTRFSIFCNVGFITSLNGLYLFGVCYCGYGILTGTISYGTLTAVTQLISQIQSPVANITGYLPKFYAMTASAERLMEIESFEDDCDTPAFSAEKIREYYAGSLQSFGLEGAEFTYYPAVESIKELTKENQPVVLRHISVEIRRGEYVAFTGHSGCGKSTVLKLLMSVYQLDAGERFLSDSDGKHPLTAEWRRLFAYVPQGNQLMSGTIRDVVSFADRSAKQDDERIRRALEIACADTFVGELENGIDTLLGERGTGLSEGQMQRIAIARAIFSDSPILLLDESTSALDAKTEKQVLENLRRMTDKTVVIVTHRPAALEICDRILGFSEDGVTERKTLSYVRNNITDTAE